MCLCKTCAVNGQPRCPYLKKDVPEEIQKNGCSKYIKQPKQFNVAGLKTKCIQCRYLFRKTRNEQGDKSFIVCGAIPSQVKRIQPIACCPNFKPLRKKQVQKRLSRQSTAPYNPVQRSQQRQGKGPVQGNGRSVRMDMNQPRRDNRPYRSEYPPAGSYKDRGPSNNRVSQQYRVPYKGR